MRGDRDIHEPVRLWSLPASLGAVIIIGFAATLGTAILLWYGLGQPNLAAKPPLNPQDQLDLIRISLIVTGGLGGVVALVVAYRKQRIAEDANRRESTRLFNERFTAASAQLGHEAAAVRLAGIYAIAGLADDWPAGRQTCIDVLCAYLRMPYEPNSEGPRWKEGEREVRWSIIGIISDHLDTGPPIGSRNWCGRIFDFTNAVFDGGSFEDAVFSGGLVNFSGATFAGGLVSFEGAFFSSGVVAFGGATFSGGEVRFASQFSGGVVAFGSATFTGGVVSFENARFSDSYVSFAEATFSGGEVGFDRATFSGGEVGFDRATFSGAEVGFGGARFCGGVVQFDQATFSGGIVDLSGAADFRVPPKFTWTDQPTGLVLPQGDAIDDDGERDDALA